MTEEDQVSYLVKAASSLLQTEENPTPNFLKSYYLMRCRERAKDRALPDKFFSSKVRCTRCFTEWKKGTDTIIRPIPLSKRQKKRIKQYKITNTNKEYIKRRKDLLNCKELVQVCSFCKHSSITLLQKPSKTKINAVSLMETNEVVEMAVKTKKKKTGSKDTTQNLVKHSYINVYSKAKDVFSLSNKNNTLPGIVKEQKVIKNNKKKKDKFAGLCQQAVLASAKLKQGEKETTKKHNKLSLFLKPSS